MWDLFVGNGFSQCGIYEGVWRLVGGRWHQGVYPEDCLRGVLVFLEQYGGVGRFENFEGESILNNRRGDVVVVILLNGGSILVLARV